jgi:rhodanese-related sulfurtransferase
VGNCVPIDISCCQRKKGVFFIENPHDKVIEKTIPRGFYTAAILILVILGFSTCKNRTQQESVEKEKFIRKENLSKKEAFPNLVVQDGNNRYLDGVKEGIRTEVTFTLLNEGEAEASNLNIHDLSYGGCTVVSQVSRLAVGDSAKLKFIFETLGYGGKKETRKIEVRYNNPKFSPLILSVTAEVLPAEDHEVPIGELYYNFFVLVDVRDIEAFREGHIAGAIHVPEKELWSWTSRLPRDFVIYLYSEDGKTSDDLAKKLRKKGYTEALSIIGGIEEWKRRYGDRVIIEGNK